MNRWWSLFATALVAACSVFSGSESSSAPPANVEADAGADAGAEGGPPPVGGPSAGTFTLAPLTATLPIVHGAKATVKITVTRDAAFVDPITITARNLRDGITSAPLTIAAGATTGDLEVDVPKAAAQGTADGLVEATGHGLVVTTPLKTFVQGASGEV